MHRIVEGDLARLLHICSLIHAVITPSADVLLAKYASLWRKVRKTWSEWNPESREAQRESQRRQRPKLAS